MDRRADLQRRRIADRELQKRDRRAKEDAHLVAQPGHKNRADHAVGDPMAEDAFAFRIFIVHVQRIEIAGEPREVHHIRLRDGARDAPVGFPDFKVLQIPAVHAYFSFLMTFSMETLFCLGQTVHLRLAEHPESLGAALEAPNPEFNGPQFQGELQRTYRIRTGGELAGMAGKCG